MIQTLSIIGIFGGIFCAIADLFLDIKGTENKKLGKTGVVDSQWETMKHWRFVWSDILAMFAVPMYSCGFIALMLKLATTHQTLVWIMSIVFLCGAMGGFMIHTFLCIVPTIYQKSQNKENAIQVIETIFRQIYVPFFTLYALLVIVPSLVVMGLILMEILQVPLWCMILNPLVMQIIGLLFRATKLDIFIDAPSCCAASLGLACYGILALLV